MKPNIQVVILDLGGVVLELDWKRVSRAVSWDKNENTQSLPQFIGSWDLYDQYERGAISTQQFFTLLKQKLEYRDSDRRLISHWNSLIVGPIKGVDPLLKSVATKLPLFGLTNSNDAHCQHIFQKFEILTTFEKVFTSFDLGLRKPEAQIYTAVLKELNCDPEQVLFIDDSEKNVESARSLGINAQVCINSAPRLKKIFLDYNIINP